MKYLVLKSAFGAAFVTLGISFLMLSTEVALACHAIGIPSVVGNPGSPECNAALAAAAAPEIGATGSLAALAAVGAIAALVWERRKNR
jgi:ABC-type transport system involved in cytochrome c biogenesis permease subunit